MQNEKDSAENGQIDLKDIVEFFKSNGKSVAIMAAVGLLLSGVYLQLTPRKYEARLFLEMAQLAQADGGTGNIEAPATLAERLRYPAGYSEAVIKACGIGDTGAIGEYLGGMLKVSASRTMPDAVEIQVRALTPELAKQCAESLAPMIVKKQHDLIEEQLLGRAEQLAGYQRALASELRELEAIKKTEAGSFGYLAKLDKLSWLRTRIDQLQEVAMLAQKHPTKLVMPIYVSSNPVFPKVKLALFLGLLIGAFLGVFLALAKTAWRKVNA